MDFTAENRGFWPKLCPQSVRIHKKHSFWPKSAVLDLGSTQMSLEFS